MGWPTGQAVPFRTGPLPDSRHRMHRASRVGAGGRPHLGCGWPSFLLPIWVLVCLEGKAGAAWLPARARVAWRVGRPRRTSARLPAAVAGLQLQGWLLGPPTLAGALACAAAGKTVVAEYAIAKAFAQVGAAAGWSAAPCMQPSG